MTTATETALDNITCFFGTLPKNKIKSQKETTVGFQTLLVTEQIKTLLRQTGCLCYVQMWTVTNIGNKSLSQRPVFPQVALVVKFFSIIVQYSHYSRLLTIQKVIIFP